MNGKKKCKYCGQELKNENNVVCERCALYLIDAICEDEEEKLNQQKSFVLDYWWLFLMAGITLATIIAGIVIAIKF